MKRIPQQLQQHLAGGATTVCLLLRVECVGRWSGTVLGFTTLDAPLHYDDGQGDVAYAPDQGFTPKRFEQASDFGVDNSEAQGWVSDDVLTRERILAGMLDYANFSLYRVNYMDLSQGHATVLYGTLGQTQIDGLRWTVELRSLMQQAKQTIGQVYSLTCRARFGDHRCGLPLAWTDSRVSAVGEQALRFFTAQDLTQAAGYFDLGIVQWLSGSNAGAEMEIDTFAAGGQVRLSYPLGLAIKEGDRFRIRQDCDKTFSSCKAKGNSVNFRGEHLTPVADRGLHTPGAYVKSVGAS